MSSPSRPESGTPGLQFDRAIPASGDESNAAPAMTCPRCQQAIRSHYYHVDGAPACPACKQRVEQELAKRRSPATMARAALFGFGAALVGAIVYYGVIALLDLEIGIVAILCGYLVAKGVRRGSGGVGGRRYQIMAVALTYLSVAMAYVPLAIKGASEARSEKAVAAPAARRAVADSAAVGSDSTVASDSTAPAAVDSATVAPAKPAAKPARKSISVGGALLALAIVVGLTLALPVMIIFGTLPSGLLSAIIIGIGMRQAWRLTADVQERITGPYKVSAAAAGA